MSRKRYQGSHEVYVELLSTNERRANPTMYPTVPGKFWYRITVRHVITGAEVRGVRADRDPELVRDWAKGLVRRNRLHVLANTNHMQVTSPTA